MGTRVKDTVWLPFICCVEGNDVGDDDDDDDMMIEMRTTTTAVREGNLGMATTTHRTKTRVTSVVIKRGHRRSRSDTKRDCIQIRDWESVAERFHAECASRDCCTFSRERMCFKQYSYPVSFIIVVFGLIKTPGASLTSATRPCHESRFVRL